MDISSFLTHGAIVIMLSYAAKTIPMPANRWFRWAIGVIQFGLSNSEIGKKNFEKSE